ncbi:cupin domain-containing protein [Paenibacillus beijingensis]|uniref:Uncharacterized protein n=1 Tax=Paenibacillus beijingensis TaxID=1126833 RepID=A0A0D5NI76_9BACL|nr:cupin domain-containing protein [Paenibacillus beijingensis]AJY74662.1 hypothetical protein VN24_08825 [Paenibacillus beijingensis]
MEKPMPEIRTYRFEDDDVIPNNPQLPVVVYIGAMAERPGEMESVFNRNNWRNSWINGVFGYHHYHSNAHEVLGVVSGSAVLQLGGDEGEKIGVHGGDVLVLPAGTGHKRLTSSVDFSVAGAYPDGMDYNLNTGAAGERPRALEEIARVPLPETDPLYGEDGPLLNIWKR